MSDNIGFLGANVEHRVSDSVSLFANASANTNKQWEALTGVKVTW